MATCPKCGRNSLEFSYGRKQVWCLYINDCEFQESVKDQEEFNLKFEYSSYNLKNTHDNLAKG